MVNSRGFLGRPPTDIHVGRALTRCGTSKPFSDSDLAREYELEIDTQFIPLSIYTLELDYPDVAVQVSAVE